MWSPVKLPYFCERLIVFSIPENDVVWVLSYEGLHRIALSPNPAVETNTSHAEDYTLLDQAGTRLTSAGITVPVLGLYGGIPQSVHPDGRRLVADFDAGRVSVVDRKGVLQQEIGFTDLSGDWGFATFSTDGRYLAIGMPYKLLVLTEAAHDSPVDC